MNDAEPPVTVTDMGAAWLDLVHDGVRTDIESDLTAPVLERRITLEFDRGTLIGHYPISASDHFAQLRVESADGGQTEAFADDALTAFIVHTYRAYADGAGGLDTYAIHREVVRILDTARTLATGRAEAGRVAVAGASR